jgi:hypothetical protein
MWSKTRLFSAIDIKVIIAGTIAAVSAGFLVWPTGSPLITGLPHHVPMVVQPPDFSCPPNACTIVVERFHVRRDSKTDVVRPARATKLALD